MHHGVMAMTGSGPAMMNPAAMSAMAEPETVETRFGRVSISRNQPVIFPNGLLGLPDKMQFALANFPSEKMNRFKLLQSLEDASLSFITLPVDVNNTIVAQEDLLAAAKDLDIPVDQLATLFIVSVHRESGAVKLSVNARAPILVHTGRRTAAQHVFSHAKYQIRQPLTL